MYRRIWEFFVLCFGHIAVSVKWVQFTLHEEKGQDKIKKLLHVIYGTAITQSKLSAMVKTSEIK